MILIHKKKLKTFILFFVLMISIGDFSLLFSQGSNHNFLGGNDNFIEVSDKKININNIIFESPEYSKPKLVDFQIEEKIDFNLNSDSNANLKRIILFKKTVDKQKRIEIIRNWIPNCNIEYNYDIIPGISVILKKSDLNLLLENINQISEISKITKNHITSLNHNLEYSSKYSNNSDWSVPFSFENWWLDAINARDIPYTGKNIKLAIMDTGISVHPDFFGNNNPKNSRIISSKNFTFEQSIKLKDYTYDDFGHGTHCAGIAGGNGFLSSGKYRGVAPDVQLIDAKVSNSTGMIAEDDVIAAIQWCIEEGANIISMSFGGGGPEVWTIESLAIEEAVKNGVIVVCAAGNSGPHFFSAGSPGSGLSSISVGATDINNHVVSFSSLGPSYTNQLIPDICAPGVNIISVDSINSKISTEFTFAKTLISQKGNYGYVPLSGTSMACPTVAGAIALLLEAYPNATPETIRNSLIMGASQIERPSNEGHGLAQGSGLINVSESLEFLASVNSTEDSVNDQVKMFPRVLPYAPYDLLKFPGDKQQMNCTIFAGKSLDISISLPRIDGIKITIKNHEYKLVSNHIQSFPIKIEVLPNASVGVKTGYIKLIDKESGKVHDQILINLTVALPKGKILFDSYHGLNDNFPSVPITFSQIDLYHAMYDLYSQNFSLTYFMQNWTVDYSYKTNASIINPQLLSGIDVLVLQAPILPYSNYEISVIKDFFENGGSILYLGTKSENICLNSLNKLFNTLKTDISIKSENVFDLKDYGIYASYKSKIISKFNENSSIFKGIDKYFYGFGNTFDISDKAISLASYEEKSVAAFYNGTPYNRGSLITLGDFHTVYDSIYNDPNFYKNHSRFLTNIFTSLIPSQKYKMTSNLQLNPISDEKLNITYRIYNSFAQNPINGLENGDTINVTLNFDNGSSENLLINYDLGGEGLYWCDIDLSSAYISNKPINIAMNISVNLKIYTFNQQFFFYPDEIRGYSKIWTNDGEISNGNKNLYLSTDNNTYLLDAYVGISTDTFLSKNSVTELNIAPKYNVSNDANYSINFNPSKFASSGNGYVYCITNSSSLPNFVDLNPKRFKFTVFNENPSFSMQNSTFGGTSFSETRTNDNIYIINSLFGIKYPIEIEAYDQSYSGEKNHNLTIVCSILPVYIYNGYITLLLPIEIIKEELKYSSSTESFNGNISFPENLNFSRCGYKIEKSMTSDLVSFFSMVIITIKDFDGTSEMFYILFSVLEKPLDLNNYMPILGLISILAIGVFVLNFNKNS